MRSDLLMTKKNIIGIPSFLSCYGKKAAKSHCQKWQWQKCVNDTRFVSMASLLKSRHGTSTYQISFLCLGDTSSMYIHYKAKPKIRQGFERVFFALPPWAGQDLQKVCLGCVSAGANFLCKWPQGASLDRLGGRAGWRVSKASEPLCYTNFLL